MIYVFQHGAKIIYDTGGGNLFKKQSLESAFDLSFGLQASTQVKRSYHHLLPDMTRDFFLLQMRMYEPKPDRTFVNPYIHFGQDTVWPRGFPMELVSQNSREQTCFLAGNESQPLIQQGMINGQPDVDSIFCMTRVSRFDRHNCLADLADVTV